MEVASFNVLSLLLVNLSDFYVTSCPEENWMLNGERIVDVGTAYITFGTSIVRVSCVGALPGGDVLQQYLRTL